MNKNFGLSESDFDRIVTDLKRNETRFFEQVFLRHFKDCMAYLRREYRADYDDAYDATMDTLIEFRRRLVEGKLRYGNLKFLFTRMATQIYVRNQKSFQTREIEGDELDLMDTPPVDEEDITLLNMAWNELGEGCQELLKLYYYGQMRLAEIAEQEQKTAAAIRKQKERCVAKIRTLLLNKKQKMYDE